MQRLKTSKVANVGRKARVWPDKQCLGAVWRLRGGGFWNGQKPRRGRGICIGLYFGRDPDQVMYAPARNRLSERKGRESSGNANGHAIPYTDSSMEPLSGYGRRQAGCEWPLRRRRKWSLRWRESVWPMQLGRKRQGLGGRVFCTAAPMADRPVNPRRATQRWSAV
jgi:hypothetical protein